VYSVGASERVAIAESGYESENLGSDRHLRDPFPILREATPELLELGGEKEPFAATASEGRMDLGERQA